MTPHCCNSTWVLTQTHTLLQANTHKPKQTTQALKQAKHDSAYEQGQRTLPCVHQQKRSPSPQTSQQVRHKLPPNQPILMRPQSLWLHCCYSSKQSLLCSQGWPSLTTKEKIQVLCLAPCLMCMRVPTCPLLLAHSATHNSTHAASAAQGGTKNHMCMQQQGNASSVSEYTPRVCLEATVRELRRRGYSSNARQSTGAPTQTAQHSPALQACANRPQTDCNRVGHLQPDEGVCRKRRTPRTSAPNHHSTHKQQRSNAHSAHQTAAFAAPRDQSTIATATGRVVETL